ncbi:SpvB/TcaC N-terminal domain-containing protein [Enterobacter kobei]|uniref:SpvB/TcaC N-terminal domain-containing protein n=1 Tax=Enterobacter kobei TaxID=208224 RepID=UPI003CF71B49
MMQNTDILHFNPPSLPSGGGAITGLKGDMGSTGPSGAATYSIPLPVSPGRGYAPPLTLGYHSQNGNSPWGMGWSLSLPSVRIRTKKGAPAWDGTDEFVGPDNDVLVPALNDDGTPESRGATTLLSTQLGGNFTVTVYRSRTERDFSRLEYWVPDDDTEQDFWVQYSPDGQVLLFGRNVQARLSHPQTPARTAVWLCESSVSSTGEQIYWQYRAEDNIGCQETETATHPNATAQRYLEAVWYGNRHAARKLPALTPATVPGSNDWLFVMVMDYGERGTDPSLPPSWLAPGSGDWLCRQDSFSSLEFGFGLRTRRLCWQALMYHAVEALSGQDPDSDNFTLVSRLLLDYNESPSMSTLKSVRQLAYEADGTLRGLPPLSLSWQTFSLPETIQWQPRPDMGNFNLMQPWQMVDLNGEGLAGLLWQNGGAWWYRPPVRQTGGDPDAVTWGNAEPLPVIPSLRYSAMLVDLDGDGYLEWIVTAPGVRGHYRRTPEREWQHFTRLSALPVEYAHPRMLMADVTGDGLPDMILIGPKSVRLYSGDGDGWEKVSQVTQDGDITLPVPGANPAVMFAFSDVLGSGQQHLVQVRADGVTCWPNEGRGHFGLPVDIEGFSQPANTFNPDQVFLADIDGSGTADLIYALSDNLLIWFNQSGNQFSSPVTIPLPEGVRYDRTCRLQLADIQGLGVASLVLTVPHLAVQNWICHLSDVRPGLLSGVNNNMGADYQLEYRSSAQFWLDEKSAYILADKAVPPCHLPFAIHCHSRTSMTDEITGNCLISSARYAHGVWDGREREFRGFGFVEVTDTDTLSSQGTGDVITSPAVSRSWYGTGMAEVDDHLSEEYWQGDSAAFPFFTPRLTDGSGTEEQEYAPDEAILFWLNRGCGGILLRNELYGADNSDQAGIPYSVTESRPQVRLIEDAAASPYPVVWPSVVESRSYAYERVNNDPQCSQQIVLYSDDYGFPLSQVSVNYPRRPKPTQSPYPDTLPDNLQDSNYDEQQEVLILVQAQSRWHHLLQPEDGIWATGGMDASRSDIFLPAVVPEEGVTLEWLLSDNSPVTEGASYTLAGQQQISYLDAQGEATTTSPSFPLRVHSTETAVMDESLLSEFVQDFSPERLKQAGYTQFGYLFPRAEESAAMLWSKRHGYVTYDSAERFFQPVTYRDTLLTGAVCITRDTYDCVLTQTADAAGLVTSFSYDWRFLTPVRMTDANDNVHQITLDALGRVVTARFGGTENGNAAGYSDTSFSSPETAEDALARVAPLPVAQCVVYIPDSWMADTADKLPPHVVTLQTDRYDTDNAQQVRQVVGFSDGFGRMLQNAVRFDAGDAWQRTDSGGLVTDASGQLVPDMASERWAVSGRTEYDNKGQVIRTYQPYFLNSWKYVRDDSARQDLLADTHYYDPVGREYQVITAKGWLRRTLFTPWFLVSEDENDTQI